MPAPPTAPSSSFLPQQCHHCSNHIPRNSHSHSNASDRIKGHVARSHGMTRIEREKLVPALANRNFHLPGHSLCGDWLQYVLNNHPVLGICFHHRLHPIRVGMRLVNLVGSVMFGLAVTNIIWLWFMLNEDVVDEEKEIITVGVGETITQQQQQNNATTASTYGGFSEGQFSVTQGMIILWTVGGGLHALFDQTIWFFTACTCCLPGQPLECCSSCRKYMHYVVMFAVAACTAIATYVIVVRADLENTQGGDPDDLAQNNSTYLEEGMGNLFGKKNKDSTYDFLISYAMELALALFVYNPLIATIFFSGILGCGRIPVLGGRPYELRQQERLRMKRQTRTVNSASTFIDPV